MGGGGGGALLEACHSESKLSSSHEKWVKKHAHELLRIIVRLKMPCKCCWSAQMMRLIIQASFLESTLKRIAI